MKIQFPMSLNVSGLTVVFKLCLVAKINTTTTYDPISNIRMLAKLIPGVRERRRKKEENNNSGHIMLHFGSKGTQRMYK